MDDEVRKSYKELEEVALFVFVVPFSPEPMSRSYGDIFVARSPLSVLLYRLSKKKMTRSPKN